MKPDPCPACGGVSGLTPGCRTCPAWVGSREIRRLGAEVRAHGRERLADELGKVAARLAGLAGDPGRTLGLLSDLDTAHLESLSDHIAACSTAVRDGRAIGGAR